MAYNRPWTAADDKFVADNRNTMTMDEVAECLGRTRKSVIARAWRNKIKINKQYNRHSYKRALPPERHKDMQLFLKIVEAAKEKCKKHKVNIDLERLRSIYWEVENTVTH